MKISAKTNPILDSKFIFFYCLFQILFCLQLLYIFLSEAILLNKPILSLLLWLPSTLFFLQLFFSSSEYRR